MTPEQRKEAVKHMYVAFVSSLNTVGRGRMEAALTALEAYLAEVGLVTLGFGPFPTTHNWDSYKGLPTTDAAKDMLRSITACPTSRGGILIGVDGEKVTVDINEEGRITYVAWETE